MTVGKHISSHIKPLLDIHCEYERRDSSYPESVSIAMADGKVIKYTIDVKQPHPAFLKALDGIRKIGYEMKKPASVSE